MKIEISSPLGLRADTEHFSFRHCLNSIPDEIDHHFCEELPNLQETLGNFRIQPNVGLNALSFYFRCEQFHTVFDHPIYGALL